MSEHNAFPKDHRGLYKLTPRQLKFLHNKTNSSNVNELGENLASQCSLRPTARSISTGSNMPGCSNSKIMNNSNLVGNRFVTFLSKCVNVQRGIRVVTFLRPQKQSRRLD